MKKKEKIIGSLVIAILATIFLFIGYSKSNDKGISEKEMERLFLDNDGNQDENNNSESNEKKNNLEDSNKENILNKNEKDLNIDTNLDDDIGLESNLNNEDKENRESQANNKIVVEVKGEVRNPDVYVLEEGSRIFELIEKAGGPTENADLSNVNRALYLSDGQCIIVKNINDIDNENNNVLEKNQVNMDNSSVVANTNPVDSTGNDGSEESGEVININSASKDGLMTLNGIGESKAQAIIDYREENGGFKSIEDITNITGIGEKTLEKIKDKISVK